MTEREKMLSGEMYDPMDPELVAGRAKARRLTHELNHIHPDEEIRKTEIVKELIGSAKSKPWIEPPFYCDYGSNIHVGEEFFSNFNCTMLDVAPITIGDQVMLATNVQLLTATHPIEAKARHSGKEYGLPITIGSRVWIGGGVIVLPGVTIGDGAVIGSGSVVTKDIPANVVAVGNPCRVVKQIDQE